MDKIVYFINKLSKKEINHYRYKLERLVTDTRFLTLFNFYVSHENIKNKDLQSELPFKISQTHLNVIKFRLLQFLKDHYKNDFTEEKDLVNFNLIKVGALFEGGQYRAMQTALKESEKIAIEIEEFDALASIYFWKIRISAILHDSYRKTLKLQEKYRYYCQLRDGIREIQLIYFQFVDEVNNFSFAKAKKSRDLAESLIKELGEYKDLLGNSIQFKFYRTTMNYYWIHLNKKSAKKYIDQFFKLQNEKNAKKIFPFLEVNTLMFEYERKMENSEYKSALKTLSEYFASLPQLEGHRSYTFFLTAYISNQMELSYKLGNFKEVLNIFVKNQEHFSKYFDEKYKYVFFFYMLVLSIITHKYQIGNTAIQQIREIHEARKENKLSADFIVGLGVMELMVNFSLSNYQKCAKEGEKFKAYLIRTGEEEYEKELAMVKLIVLFVKKAPTKRLSLVSPIQVKKMSESYKIYKSTTKMLNNFHFEIPYEEWEKKNIPKGFIEVFNKK